MELQGRVAEIERTGRKLAAISYDPPETLKAFADRAGITFTLLSDPGSAIIKRYGLLNEAAEGRTEGIPHPGTFVLDAAGMVTARYFEESYRVRSSAASIALKLGEDLGGASRDNVARLETDHLEVVARPSDEIVAPGTMFSLALDVTPKAKMHVYAPGEHTYQVVALDIEPQPGLVVRPAVYPASQEYYFAPLDERVPVYTEPFRLVRDLNLAVSSETRELSSAPDASLELSAVLSYQACDDKICYPMQSIPVSWTVRLKPLEQ